MYSTYQFTIVGRETDSSYKKNKKYKQKKHLIRDYRARALTLKELSWEQEENGICAYTHTPQETPVIHLHFNFLSPSFPLILYFLCLVLLIWASYLWFSGFVELICKQAFNMMMENTSTLMFIRRPYVIVILFLLIIRLWSFLFSWGGGIKKPADFPKLYFIKKL